ncbi:glycosyltransferase family 2 protein [Moheibacter sediminis]|uniref:Glycosyltransferase involved in cell wall bisynthesis n=1 Tax=Moheibacter sediminis TaxID=1434700 RepID=A0A1W2BAR7_9FLAO|nr:glycosyltransferase family A protein [Moheibacter sediminis]SMC69870.1 Glycosyltransferase involved in cell wall bisynthesis [Moheibacter sediminis]
MGEISDRFGSRTKSDMIMKPKVAVITLYYNRRDHVVDSINSLLNQTYENLEIIIVDDCSKDDTYEIIQKTVTNSSRVKCLKNEHNKGFTQTLIDTINNTEAEYIAIHGAGDISLPTRIEEQVKHLENNLQVGVVTTDITNSKKSKFHKTEITLDDLLQKNRITHGAVMFRKKPYDEVGGYRTFFTTRQDKDLWFRMSLITKIHFLNKKLYELVEIKKSVSQTASLTGMPTLISGFAKFLILERIKTGTDSLDLFGASGALYYNPSTANTLFYKNLRINILQKNINNVISYLNILIKINTNRFLIAAYKIFRKLLIYSKR